MLGNPLKTHAGIERRIEKVGNGCQWQCHHTWAISKGPTLRPILADSFAD
jgi:hypothetical protein